MLQDSAIYNLDRKGTAYEQKQQNKTKGIKIKNKNQIHRNNKTPKIDFITIK